MVDNFECEPFYEDFPLKYISVTPKEQNIVVRTGGVVQFAVETDNCSNNDWYHNGERRYTMNGVKSTHFGRTFNFPLGVHTVEIESYNNISSIKHQWNITVLPLTDENGNEIPVFDLAVRSFSPSYKYVTINKGESIFFYVQTINECDVKFNDGIENYQSIITEPYTYTKELTFENTGEYLIKAIIKRSIYEASIDWYVTVKEIDNNEDDTNKHTNSSSNAILAVAITCGTIALIYKKKNK